MCQEQRSGYSLASSIIGLSLEDQPTLLHRPVQTPDHLARLLVTQVLQVGQQGDHLHGAGDWGRKW